MTDLIWSQDSEGSYHLLSRVRICCFSGHEVNEGLESDGSLSIGVNQGHDSSKLSFTLSENPKQAKKKKKGHHNQSLTAHTSHEPIWGRGYKVSKASSWLRNINVTVSEIWDLKWLPLFCKMALVLLKKILFVPNTQYFPSINFLQLLLFPILILVKLVLTLHFSPPS